MDTHRLEYFLRIAEEGPITRAATALGVAQPALSRQVRLLEEDLGIDMFQRTRRASCSREEVTRLVRSGRWRARIASAPDWDPDHAEPQQV